MCPELIPRKQANGLQHRANLHGNISVLHTYIIKRKMSDIKVTVHQIVSIISGKKDNLDFFHHFTREENEKVFGRIKETLLSHPSLYKLQIPHCADDKKMGSD